MKFHHVKKNKNKNRIHSMGMNIVKPTYKGGQVTRTTVCKPWRRLPTATVSLQKEAESSLAVIYFTNERCYG